MNYYEGRQLAIFRHIHIRISRNSGIVPGVRQNLHYLCVK